MAEQIFNRAKRDLSINAEDKPTDFTVWEHCSRTAGLAEALLTVPELASKTVDRKALRLAALYHDMGWVIQAQSGELPAQNVLLKPASSHQRELAADWLLANLDGQFSAGTKKLAAEAIRQNQNHHAELLEAQILSDADNLDEIGPQAVWTMFRKQMSEGKSLADLVNTWQRREEYGYWPAWIGKCFRFPTARQLAEKRWKQLQRYMNDLQTAISTKDVLKWK